MAGELSLSRNAKLFVTTVSNISQESDLDSCTNLNTWQVAVLDGFSFTQTPTQQEIGVSEAGTTVVRGQQVFNTALEPVNWSFSSYMRPRANGGSGDAVERILWEALLAPSDSPIVSNGDGDATTLSGSDTMIVTTTASNTNELLQLSLIFELGDSFFILPGAVVDTAEIDFSIDGIATINWTGFANSILRVDKRTGSNWAGAALDLSSGASATAEYVSLPTGTLACIRNKLSTMTLEDKSTGSPWNSGNPSSSIALTGGSVTFANNITFLTPESLGVLNQPCGHFTGTRTVSGNFTAYLKLGTAYTAGLLEYLSAATTADPYDFELIINVGGTTDPYINLTFPHVHLGIPNPDIQDVIQVDVTFAALPQNSAGDYDFAEANEATITYNAA